MGIWGRGLRNACGGTLVGCTQGLWLKQPEGMLYGLLAEETVGGPGIMRYSSARRLKFWKGLNRVLDMFVSMIHMR